MEELNFINPSCAICVSGHRPSRLPGCGDRNAPETEQLIVALQRELISAFDRGKFIVLHGGMAGWDIFAAEQVLRLKREYPQVQLFSIIPFSVWFYRKESCWTPEWIRRSREVFRQHDFAISLAEHYQVGVYYKRNRALIRHSSELICYYDGGKGGTKYTVDMAKREGLVVKNLFH